MAIDPIPTAQALEERFTRYLLTTFDAPPAYPELRDQFRHALGQPGRLFRGPYLHGLAPYVTGESVNDLIRRRVLPPQVAALPLLGNADRPLYRHQVQAIERLRQGRNVVVSSGTGSGKTLTFLAPILASILEDPRPGIHALLLYPMNALVNDQLKNLRRILRNVPQVRFGRYINVEVTPNSERDGRRLHPEAPPNEVVSREVFRRDPPHILVTNYAMLEYLLLRVDDSPLFSGPWRFLVVDEAHTYAGAKGSEVALLLRRLVCRVKQPADPRPQCIATSASLGTEDPARREEVLRFARTLFDATFEADDLIVAERAHAPAQGTHQIDASTYTHPAVLGACRPGAAWSAELATALRQGGFSEQEVAAAKTAGGIECALYELFQNDARILKLREATDRPLDLHTAAERVLGRSDAEAVEQLCGLVRIASLARLPGGDARLVPCRYHLFARGLNGAFVALERCAGRIVPRLFLDPTRQTPEGDRQTLELRICRKCGQPLLFGYHYSTAQGQVLRAFGSPLEERGAPLWLAWDAPQARSEDEDDEVETDSAAANFPRVGYAPATGAFRELAAAEPAADELPLWLVGRGLDLARCFACGGRNTITPVRADSDGAQTVLADTFYRCLPAAVAPPARVEALDYPGRGRKLLAFADSRQSAAYFAPYLENSNSEQLMRWLIRQALVRAEARLGDGEVDGDTLVQFMIRMADDHFLFPANLSGAQRRTACLLAVVREFCLAVGRRQSLEALALVECRVNLGRRWQPPAELLELLGADALGEVVQALLSTVRLAKALDLPEPLSASDPAFGFQTGTDAFVARGSTQVAGGSRLHGFSPTRAPRLQRRAGYLQRVLDAACHSRGSPPLAADDVVRLLDLIWQGLQSSSLRETTLARGMTGSQIRWDDLRFRSRAAWRLCGHCQQWASFDALGVCPSFRCAGRLEAAEPEELFAENHYRRSYVSPGPPVPLIAREHTAQLSPRLAAAYQAAFQDGHHPDEPQINVLSSSTTFELGVDLGDLEAVFLRNVPPSPANYQQRAGRAGRGVGSAAFAVTFSMPRSHDEHYFANPSQMIDGLVRSPRIDLSNETIYQRHLHAVLLAGFVRDWSVRTGVSLTSIGEMTAFGGDGQQSPLEQFLLRLPEDLADNVAAIDALVPGGSGLANVPQLAGRIADAFREARDYYADEINTYEEAIADALTRQQAAEQAKDTGTARRLYHFAGFLRDSRDRLCGTDWVTFFSDRCVLPSYAFPIYNVNLATADPELKLERDLRVALSEYVPGAAIVARGNLWRSVGIRLPWQRDLERRYYARCPSCWHVMRHVQPDQVFPTGSCPVCGHDGRHPKRTHHEYVVPSHGFTTDLARKGEKLAFDRPQRIPASRVLFVPQQQADDVVCCRLGSGGLRVEVRTTRQAEFFVFNDGNDPPGMGFCLCRLCGRQVDLDKQRRVKKHDRPLGRECPGNSYQRVHLGHDFLSLAARLSFAGAAQPDQGREFWLSLLYAILGGMADGLGIERNDVNGVIRPVNVGGQVLQEVVLFDDVPGGAGHALRLESEEELVLVLKAAHARVANCTCGESASCYACLRSYGNQYCHDLLSRGPVAEYLARLLEVVEANPDDDRPYDLPDRANALAALLREATRIDWIAAEMSDGGPPETGPWYALLLQAAARPGTAVRLAFQKTPEGRDGLPAHLLALAQSGVGLFRMKEGAAPPPYALFGRTDRGANPRFAAFLWGEGKITDLDGETHLRPLWFNRSQARLSAVGQEIDRWFTEQAVPVSFGDLVVTSEGCKAHAIKKGNAVAFGPIVAGLAGRTIERVHLQDPYLLTAHQLSCLADFLRAVPWPAGQATVPLELTTHMTDGDPKKRDQLSPIRQREELEKRLGEVTCAKPKLTFRHPRYAPLHMRFALFDVAGGGRILYVFERGLDVRDPDTGKARADTYALEFTAIPAPLASLLKG